MAQQVHSTTDADVADYEGNEQQAQRAAAPRGDGRGPLRRALSHTNFVIAAGVLLVAAVGLNAVVSAMQLHFKKVAVPLPDHNGDGQPERLDDPEYGVPARMGPWVLVTKDEPLDPDIEHVLGTHDFVFRSYVDSRLVAADEIAAFKDKSTPERQALLSKLTARNPEAVVNIAVTYYTGMADTVAHIPDRCMVADGYEPKEGVQVMGRTFGAYADGPARELSYRFIHFEDTTAKGRVDRNVAYTFHVNGRYEADPRGVRFELQNLLQRHGYYAKVELMPAVADEDRAVEIIDDVLAAALPEIERCLPDWEQVQARAEAE